MVEITFGPLVLRTAEGDLTEFSADVLVNAANNRLWMGGGVAGALKRKGGREIEKEAVSKGPIGIGEAVATGAGRLRARWVVHAAVMGMDFRTDRDKIYRAAVSAMRVSDSLGAASVAFPALGTGVGGFPFAEAAQVMASAVRDVSGEMKNVREVYFVLYGKEAYTAFEEALRTFQ